TILSRCQLVKIPSFSSKSVLAYIKARFSLDDKKAADISRVANGNLIRAIELCENEDSSLVNLERFKNLMRFAWKRDVISLISWSEEVAAIGREQQKNFISFSLRLLRENLMLTLDQMKNSLVFLADEEAGFSVKFHPFINQTNASPFADELNLAYSHIESNGNARIIFLDLALKLTRLIEK
ncbi:MAG: DNA polymerase III subunit delta, partial [Bacteroidales bacterium]